MPLPTPPSDPAPADWVVRPLAAVVDLARARARDASPAPAVPVLAVDGRSASGKTSLAARIVAATPGAWAVHTDDVAWYESMFGWEALLRDHVLAPARRGEPVAYRPPPWDERGRPGAIEVPTATTLLVVEGVGASRAELEAVLDATVWVHTPDALREEREAGRIARGEVRAQLVEEWAAEEDRFVAARRPWARVDVIAAGAPPAGHDPASEVVVATGGS